MKNVKFVMIDEVQDYTETQLWCLESTSRAHFRFWATPTRAIWEDTATFEQIEKIFTATHGEGAVSHLQVFDQLPLFPGITALFTSLERRRTRPDKPVQRGGQNLSSLRW